MKNFKGKSEIKQVLLLGLFVICSIELIKFLSGCNETKQKPISPTITIEGDHILIQNGVFKRDFTMKEFDYKGHTYVYCDVRNDITPTHAGHCKCNRNY